jgi:hypothetical protein
MLLFEFQNGKDGLGLSLLIGPGPAETRQRVFDHALSNKSVFNPRNRTPGKNHGTIFRRPILTKKDYESPDLIQMRVTIESVLAKVISDDLDRILDHMRRVLK